MFLRILGVFFMIDDVQKYLAEMTVKLIGDRWKMQIIQTLMVDLSLMLLLRI